MFFKSKKVVEVPDNELIRNYKESGETQYAGILFNRYSHLVFGVCMKYLKEEEAARDAVMSIFEKLLTDLKKHDVGNFKPWIHMVARNFCLMELRKRKSSGQREEISENFMESGYVLHLHNEDETEFNLKKLEECVGLLGNEQKWCVELFFLQEKCYKEISELTAYTLNEVKSFIQNGKRNLKNCMDRKHG